MAIGRSEAHEASHKLNQALQNFVAVPWTADAPWSPSPRMPGASVSGLGASTGTWPRTAPILLLGAPRSGTTWLGKIFDSHPDVLYRHEPDTVRQDDELPWICPDHPDEIMTQMAQTYLRRLAVTATLRTSGKPPFFRKSYRGPVRSHLRTAIIVALRVMELGGMGRRHLSTVRVPDLISASAVGRIRVAVKSTSVHGRARAFAQALPRGRFVLIVRDPWGYVTSLRRGMKLRLMAKPPLDWIADSVQAHRYGLTAAQLSALPELEQLAWNWLIYNEKVIDDLSGLVPLKVISYRDLCEDPVRQTRDLFAFAGLDWNRQTEDFIARSTTFRGRERYYQVFKTSSQALNRWREDMPAEEQQRTLSVARHSSLLSRFLEFGP